MPTRKLLSEYPTSQSWLGQFGVADQAAAKQLLDAVVLINEEEVSASLRTQLYKLADFRPNPKRRFALYAEREFGGAAAFQTESVMVDGKMRRRAVGRTGPAPVRPTRGSTRVGSEGLVAFIISQATEARPDAFMNHPGPDLIRGKTRPAGTIAILTDFIGSGSRIRSVLDAFWAVPSVRAWASRHWIDFKVIAAAATHEGALNVRRHRVSPEVHFQHAIPTIARFPNWKQRSVWHSLINRYGPLAGRGASRYGFGEDSALVAFNYRLPNNTPALLHKTAGGWRALYTGPAPEDLRSAFGLRTREQIVARAATDAGVALAGDLAPDDAALIIMLRLLRGRWRSGAEVALAQRMGMPVPDVIELLLRALKKGYLTGDGRLTDQGQSLLTAGRRDERKRPEIATNAAPYYPQQLRTPGAHLASATRSEWP